MNTFDLTIPGLPIAQGNKRASDAEILDAYQKTGSVWKAGLRLGLCGQSVYERLVKLDAINPMRVFTEEEKDRLKNEYLSFRNAGKLQTLAESMGRTKPFICRQARALGLTNKAGPRRWNAKWKYLSDEAIEVIWNDFVTCRSGLGEFCRMRGYDPLGFSRTMRGRYEDIYDLTIESKAPKQSMYRLGRAVEYRARDFLKSLGYFVLRSPASRSPIDLVAVKKGVILFVQCKRSGALGVSEWNELMDLCLETGALPILGMKNQDTGRGIKFMILTGKKDGSKKRQPYEPWNP